ncbi:hypothetical protein HDU91_006263 [Kappamyces sp. JEL0680]|nr:hypothetical protein HDU91_006263 [Kappamyces sp. JEL0680]
MRVVLSNPLVIPLFQRRYCWSQQQISRLFLDIVGKEKEDGPYLGTHRIGKCMFSLLDPSLDSLLIVDGQQRITSIMLLLAVLRDAALALGNEGLVDEIEAVIFTTPSSQTRLTPSHSDQVPFRALMQRDGQPIDRNCILGANKLCLQDDLAAYLLTQTGSKPADGPASTADHRKSTAAVLSAVFLDVLDKTSILNVVVENHNLPQVFGWLQEKSIFSALSNPAGPGTRFLALDWIRNLLLAPVSGMSDLAAFYEEHWLALERRFESSKAFDDFVMAWADSMRASRAGSGISDFEEQVADLEEDQFQGIQRYARFYSLWEHEFKDRNKNGVETSIWILTQLKVKMNRGQ